MFSPNSSDSSNNTLQSILTQWNLLCASPSTISSLLIPITYAIIAAIKVLSKQPELELASKILPAIGHCLDSTDSEKRACGLALAQICARITALQKPDAENPPPQFDSSSPIFSELLTFFDQDDDSIFIEEKSLTKLCEAKSPRPVVLLDSDDEEELCSEMGPELEDGDCEFEVYDQSNDTKIDETLQEAKVMAAKKKGDRGEPMYFTDIVELFVEGHQGGNEAEKQVFKQVGLLKIPVLLYNGVRMDYKMAQQLTRLVN